MAQLFIQRLHGMESGLGGQCMLGTGGIFLYILVDFLVAFDTTLYVILLFYFFMMEHGSTVLSCLLIISERVGSEGDGEAFWFMAPGVTQV